MSKIRLENAEMINELCHKTFVNYNHCNEYSDDGDYDESWEITEGISVSWLYHINNVLGNGCLMIDEDLYNEVMNGYGQDFIDEIYIDMKQANFNNISDQLFISADEVTIEKDGTMRLWWD